MTPPPIKSRSATSFVTASVAVTALSIMLFKAEVLPQGALSVLTITWTSVTDAALLFIPFLWIRPEWRWSFVAALSAAVLLIYINIVYSRNFTDIIPAGMYSIEYAGNEFVVRSFLDSVRLYDLFWLFLPLVAADIVISCHENGKADRRLRFYYAFTCLILLIGSLVIGLRRTSIEYKTGFRDTIAQYAENWNMQLSWLAKLRDYGFTGYSIKILTENLQSNHTLTPLESDMIADALKAPADSLPQCHADILSHNSQCNLVLIIVESLSSSVLDLPYINSVAPTLTSMLADSTVIRAPKLKVLAGAGRSSDGQFIINTGLLPLRHEAFVSRYASADYPSLPKALLHHFSAEIISEPRSLWSHGLTSLSYGYDSLTDNVAPSSTLNRDSIIFNRASDFIQSCPRPFCILISTVSMHDPYQKPDVSVNPEIERAIPPDIDPRDRNYLLRLAHFDESLAGFIRFLENSDLFDNSVIVITGDHEIRHNCISPMLADYHTPLFIINSGIGKLVSDTTATQADIFPTILDVMSVDSYRSDPQSAHHYRGLGSSLLRTPRRPLSDKTWHASELMIRSRYFN